MTATYTNEPKIILREWFRGDIGSQTYAGLTDPNSANRGSANWIYDDKPRDELGENSYPRVSISTVNEANVLRGGASTLSYDRHHLQISIYTAERNTNLTSGGKSYDAQQLSTILGRQIITAFRNSFKLDKAVLTRLYIPTNESFLVSNPQPRRDEERDLNVWVKDLEVIVRGFDTGE